MHILMFNSYVNFGNMHKNTKQWKKKYNNEEVKQIREYLYLLAQLQIESEIN